MCRTPLSACRGADRLASVNCSASASRYQQSRRPLLRPAAGTKLSNLGLRKLSLLESCQASYSLCSEGTASQRVCSWAPMTCPSAAPLETQKMLAHHNTASPSTALARRTLRAKWHVRHHQATRGVQEQLSQ